MTREDSTSIKCGEEKEYKVIDNDKEFLFQTPREYVALFLCVPVGLLFLAPLILVLISHLRGGWRKGPLGGYLLGLCFALLMTAFIVTWLFVALRASSHRTVRVCKETGLVRIRKFLYNKTISLDDIDAVMLRVRFTGGGYLQIRLVSGKKMHLDLMTVEEDTYSQALKHCREAVEVLAKGLNTKAEYEKMR